MKNILISAIGGDVAQSAARIVRQRFPDWRIFGIDMGCRHGGRLFVDHFENAPPAGNPEYLEWVEHFVIAKSIDCFLPTTEPELARFAASDIPDELNSRLLWAGKKAVEIGCDKLSTAKFIAGLGLPSPWTLPAGGGVIPPAFPCLFKLRSSAGSKAVFVCEDIGEIDFFRHRYPEAVIQEYLPDVGGEITCAVFRSRSGKVSVLQMERRLLGGFTGWARVIDDPEVMNQCRAVAIGLGLTGSINIQLRITDLGPRIFEINPRLSSTIFMRHLASFEDLVWMIEDFLCMPQTFSCPAVGTELVRVQDAAVMPEA